MKTVKTLLLLVVLTIGSQFAQARNRDCISVISMKRDIFYFKTASNFTGALVEVYSPSGDLIFTGQVLRHKSLIDFYFETPGTYTIKITKGSETEEFTFEKSSPSPYMEADPNAHHVQMG
ncbi:MAG TPA: hypothetical protein VIU12_22985 [Chryseolinea sp.]